MVGVSWPPFDEAEKTKQEAVLNGTYVQALRDLAPDMGAYVNEVRPVSYFYQS